MMKLPILIVRNDDDAHFVKMSVDKYVNIDSFKMGSIMRYEFTQFDDKNFTFYYD